MKLPATLKKRAKIGKDYILIDNGTAAFKSSLFGLSGDADTNNVEPFFPKNEGDVEVYHKTTEIKDRLCLSCADKGWLLIDKALKPIVENPEIKLTTFKDLYNDIWHTTLILSKDDEIVGIVMGMLFSQDTKEIGKAFDELNENYNIFKSLNEELNSLLEDEITVEDKKITVIPNDDNKIIVDPQIQIGELTAGFALVNMDNTYSIFLNKNGNYVETKYTEPKTNAEIALEVIEKIKEII